MGLQQAFINRQRFLRHQGFSLLELLIALAIFAVIAVLAYGGLTVVLNTREQTDLQAAQLAQLQQVFSLLARDVEQVIMRPIRNKYGDNEPAFTGEITQLEFTRAGWRNPTQATRSTLQRVRYYWSEQQWWRSSWNVLDQAQDSKPETATLLSNVTAVQIRFLDSEARWHDQWSSALSATQTTRQTNDGTSSIVALKAIEVSLTLKDWGKLTRLFRVVYLPQTEQLDRN
ncbi:general secretion pathway protein J [Beggiatoa alba B18LD]|uniref:Type II secretion system protein J n=1 Tax=Beggiatoa alba B18LD TaxID=395493 RepID=I3CIQ7_9GAMM|nr:type II secretion system minor pseudopilin GspJ [Beggiatoa alba]EIJ43500.1 general secretion pathway protein J [Beggiatoa alba B18LD]